MSYALAYQVEKYGNTPRPGDVIVPNHPAAGCSHLLDVTVISPVIDEVTNEVRFWTTSRAHHADIGGIAAGSMPPHSKEIWQEGASFLSFKIVNGRVFDEDGLAEIMLRKPATYPGCTGTRTWSNNVNDLKAQIAVFYRSISQNTASQPSRQVDTGSERIIRIVSLTQRPPIRSLWLPSKIMPRR